MTAALWLALACKSAAIAGATLLALRLLAGRSAAERAFVAHLGLAALLALPIAMLTLPALSLTAPEAVVELVGAAPDDEGTPSRQVPEPRSQPHAPPTIDVIAWLFWSPALALTGLLLVSIYRLAGLKRRAAFAADSRWQAALAAAQARLGLKHGAVLLVSAEVPSPVSWGLIRPIILLSAEAVHDVRHAEAVIAHELAHVARFDWLKLLGARLVTALFWFNPLVWVLARRCHDLCEEAADDMVLRAEVSRTDYAELLVETARREAAPRVLAVHGVAPMRSALGRRVAHLLDPGRRRAAAGAFWMLGSAVAALGIAMPVAGLSIVQPAPGLPVFAAGAGERAAAQMAALDHPAARTLAAAIRARNWEGRRMAGSTLFDLPAAIAPLLSALSDEDATVRRIAIWGLSEMRPVAVQAAGPVAAHLRDPDARVRGEAARALGDFGAIGHAAAIAQLLGDADPSVVRQAAHALGDLRQPDTRVALAAASYHPDPAVRERVRWALGQVAEAGRPPAGRALN